MARRATIGIIGCGFISDAYLTLASLFRNVEIVACADILPEASAARAAAYGVRDMTVDALLRDDGIDAVVNLTPPAAHFDVSYSALTAGKHAYSEKPMALSYAEARRLVTEADRRGLKVGAAPDTFLGAAGQAARRLLDRGTVGTVISGTAQVMSHGMEHWHPTPAFFYKPGAGPMFDVGPYYLTTLVNLLGPVRHVSAMATKGFAERLVSAEGPMKGRSIKVTTPTTLSAILRFRSGAQVSVNTSWDVWKHGHGNPIELYGTDGSLFVSDPNFFGGVIRYTEKGGDPVEVVATEPFGAENLSPRPGVPKRSNYRMLGVADMIDAAAKGREPRCSGRLAAHVVEIMESVLVSAAERKQVTLRSTTERPEPLTAADVRRLSAANTAPASAMPG